MVEPKPFRKSRTKSSADPSRAGSPAAGRATARPGPPRAQALLRDAALLDALAAGRFPPSLYIEGPDEALKAALLAEVRHAWARAEPAAPAARVLRAAESGVEEILAAYHGASLFTPRELILVLDLEGIARSARNAAALAEGVARPSGGSSLVLVESAAETPRKTLDAVRAACAVRCVTAPLTAEALIDWGRRRLAREAIVAESGLLEMVARVCENDPGEFFNELDKLIACAGPEARLTRERAEGVLRPLLGADLEEYLTAVATGQSALAARRLGRVLAAGTGEGTVLFALSNLVGGALGGWARYREPSAVLARRLRPAELARGLDALYRAEAAWKRGRADAVAVLEHATRALTPS